MDHSWELKIFGYEKQIRFLPVLHTFVEHQIVKDGKTLQ